MFVTEPSSFLFCSFFFFRTSYYGWRARAERRRRPRTAGPKPLWPRRRKVAVTVANPALLAFSSHSEPLKTGSVGCRGYLCSPPSRVPAVRTQVSRTISHSTTVQRSVVSAAAVAATAARCCASSSSSSVQRAF